MNRENPELIIRRILVALDASRHSKEALRAAIELATRFRAELRGLYVEDINLLRLAELPFSHEVGFFSARSRRLDGATLRRQLRAQAEDVRRMLESAAEEQPVDWTFDVARGPIAREVLRASENVDLVVLGKSGWSVITRRRLGSTTRSVVAQAPRLTLVLENGARMAPPVVVIFDDGPLGRKALLTAAALVEDEPQREITVLLLPHVPGTLDALREQAASLLERRELVLRYLELTRAEVPSLIRMLEEEGCGTLVLPGKSAVFREDVVLTILEEIETPVLLVR